MNTLNDLTPKIRCHGRAGVDPALIFGIDSRLFLDSAAEPVSYAMHHDEVETVIVWRGGAAPCKELACANGCTQEHHGHVPDSVTGTSVGEDTVEEQTLRDALASLDKESVYRVKGFVRVAEGYRILNWAFGRYDLHPLLHEEAGDGRALLLTVMGERGEAKRAARAFADKLQAAVA